MKLNRKLFDAIKEETDYSIKIWESARKLDSLIMQDYSTYSMFNRAVSMIDEKKKLAKVILSNILELIRVIDRESRIRKKIELKEKERRGVSIG